MKCTLGSAAVHCYNGCGIQYAAERSGKQRRAGRRKAPCCGCVSRKAKGAAFWRGFTGNVVGCGGQSLPPLQSVKCLWIYF